jgi:uncharacterized protein (AIM24 family)
MKSHEIDYKIIGDDIQLVEIELDPGETVIAEAGVMRCAAYGTKVGIAFRKKIGVGLFGGEGFILQRLEGDGMTFIHSGGTIIRRDLREGERLRMDTGCLVAMTTGVEYDIERAGSLKSMFFGGEGLFLATLEGPGTVWMQTLPFSRLADRLIASSSSGSGRSKGEGSVLGGLGRMLGGE